MTPKKLIEVGKDAIQNDEQLLVVGPPGIGKTDIVKKIASDLNADLIISHPAISDPTDYKGLPAKSNDGSHAEFLAFGESWKAINAKKKTIWFIDDLGQASEAVQKAIMQLLLGRKLNGHEISNHVVFMGATNDTNQKAGVTGLIEPVKSRWDSIIHLDCNIDDWSTWAMNNNQPVELIAFLRSRPDLLSQFTPTRELTNSPCPRTWASVGRRLARGIKDFELYAGAVGKGATTEFLAFLELAEQAPSLDAIILDPLGQKVPEKPALRYLVSVGLATRASKTNIDKIFTYLKRMPQPFRVLSLRDALNKDPKIAETRTVIDWACSAEGKEII